MSAVNFDDSLPFLSGFDWDNADNDTLFEMSLNYANSDDDMNYVLAHIFLNIAASRGCERSIEYRKELSNEMTPAQIAQAQKFARSLLFGSKPKAH